MFSSSRLEKEIILSPISRILLRGLFYPRLHPRNLVFEISLVTLQTLFFFFRGEMMVSMRHATTTK
jgi:hypothetical protein